MIGARALTMRPSLVARRMVAKQAKPTQSADGCDGRQVARRFLSVPPSGPRPPVAAKKEGLFQLSAQGAIFLILMVPVAGYTAYAGRMGPTDEELEGEINTRYKDQVEASKAKKKAMADFFDSTIKNPDGTMDDKMKDVLHAGKTADSNKARIHPVDESVFGTTEGAEAKKRQQEEIKKRADYQRRKKEGKLTPEEIKAEDERAMRMKMGEEAAVESSGASKLKALASFFGSTIKNPDGTMDDKMQGVLHAGKTPDSNKMRIHPVDEKVFGTAEGAAAKQRQQEEIQKRADYRRRKKEGKLTPEELKVEEERSSRIKRSLTMAAVATVAAAAGFVAGGRGG